MAKQIPPGQGGNADYQSGIQPENPPVVPKVEGSSNIPAPEKKADVEAELRAQEDLRRRQESQRAQEQQGKEAELKRVTDNRVDQAAQQVSANQAVAAQGADQAARDAAKLEADRKRLASQKEGQKQQTLAQVVQEGKKAAEHRAQLLAGGREAAAKKAEITIEATKARTRRAREEEEKQKDEEFEARRREEGKQYEESRVRYEGSKIRREKQLKTQKQSQAEDEPEEDKDKKKDKWDKSDSEQFTPEAMEAYNDKSQKKSKSSDAAMKAHIDGMRGSAKDPEGHEANATQYWFDKTKNARDKALQKYNDRVAELQVRKHEKQFGVIKRLGGLLQYEIKGEAEEKAQQDRIISKARSANVQKTIHELHQAAPDLALKSDDPKAFLRDSYTENQKIGKYLTKTHDNARTAERRLTPVSVLGGAKRAFLDQMKGVGESDFTKEQRKEVTKTHRQAKVDRKRDIHAAATAVVAKNLRVGGKEDGAIIDYSVQELQRTNEQLKALDHADKQADQYARAAKSQDFELMPRTRAQANQLDVVKRNFDQSVGSPGGVSSEAGNLRQQFQGYTNFQLKAHQNMRISRGAATARDQTHAMAEDLISHPENAGTLKERTEALAAATERQGLSRINLEAAERRLHKAKDPGAIAASSEAVKDYQSDYEQDARANKAIFGRKGDDVSKAETIKPTRWQKFKAKVMGESPRTLGYLAEYDKNNNFVDGLRRERNAKRVGAEKLRKQNEAQPDERTKRQAVGKRSDYEFRSKLLTGADASDPEIMKGVKEGYQQRKKLEKKRDQMDNHMAAVESVIAVSHAKIADLQKQISGKDAGDPQIAELQEKIKKEEAQVTYAENIKRNWDKDFKNAQDYMQSQAEDAVKPKAQEPAKPEPASEPELEGEPEHVVQPEAQPQVKEEPALAEPPAVAAAATTLRLVPEDKPIIEDKPASEGIPSVAPPEYAPEAEGQPSTVNAALQGEPEPPAYSEEGKSAIEASPVEQREVQSAQIEGQPAQVEGQPAQVEGQPAQVEGQPAQVEGQPAQVEGQPAQVEGQPAQIEEQPLPLAPQIEGQPSPPATPPREENVLPPPIADKAPEGEGAKITPVEAQAKQDKKSGIDLGKDQELSLKPMVAANKEKEGEKAAPETTMPKEGQQQEGKAQVEKKFASEIPTPKITATDIAVENPSGPAEPTVKRAADRPADHVSVHVTKDNTTAVPTQSFLAPKPAEGVPSQDALAGRMAQLTPSFSAQQKDPTSMPPSTSNVAADAAKVAAPVAAATTGTPNETANAPTMLSGFQRLKNAVAGFFSSIRQRAASAEASTAGAGTDAAFEMPAERKPQPSLRG